MEQEESDSTCVELVVNISSFPLTVVQRTLLSRGLSFCPVANTDWFKLEVDVQRFFRSLRLKSFFSSDRTVFSSGNDLTATDNENKGSVYEGKSLGLCVKSRFSPPHDNPIVETYVQLVQKELSELRRSEFRGRISNNLSKDEN